LRVILKRLKALLLVRGGFIRLVDQSTFLVSFSIPLSAEFLTPVVKSKMLMMNSLQIRASFSTSLAFVQG
uniref:Uncharacterized protein n=1 Tax=Cucumis melo TaxID=3656 RepID=A0A9I9E8Q8_CUCME